MTARNFHYHVVALTKAGRLVQEYLHAPSIADAVDQLIDRNSLAGQVVDYKFCVLDGYRAQVTR